MIKAPLFFDPPFPEFSDSIANSDRQQHAKIRRALAHSFSEKALQGHQEIIIPYYQRLMIALREHSREGPLNIESWINFCSFDMVGDLSMGLKFECLVNGE
jgi:cytochrome P450